MPIERLFKFWVATGKAWNASKGRKEASKIFPFIRQKPEVVQVPGYPL